MRGAFKAAGAASPSSECSITAFSLPVGAEGASVNGTINEGASPNPTIAVSAVAGTTVTALKATFTASAGAAVKVGSVSQTSGTTENDFTSPVDYVVTAEDGTTMKTYTVTVTVA